MSGREQRRWWLANPIRAWQSLWHDAHMNTEGGLAVWSEAFLLSLLSSDLWPKDFSNWVTPSRTARLQTVLSEAWASQVLVSMFVAFMSLLHTSLNRNWGLPAGRFPLASSPYRRSFGIRPSSIRATWPSQRKRLNLIALYMLDVPAFSRTDVLGTLSCHLMFNIKHQVAAYLE